MYCDTVTLLLSIVYKTDTKKNVMTVTLFQVCEIINVLRHSFGRLFINLHYKNYMNLKGKWKYLFHNKGVFFVFFVFYMCELHV